MPLPSFKFSPSSWQRFVGSVDNEQPPDATTRKEVGGVGISDPSAGLTGYVWKCSYNVATGVITLRNETTGISTPYITIAGLLTLDFAFDQNMRPYLAYDKNDGRAYLYYYSTLAGAYATLQLPSGARSPRMTHDDKRRWSVIGNLSDVCLFYINNDKVYYRVQRERFESEHQVATITSNATICSVGMGIDNRIILKIQDGSMVSSP
jgi:hypothetical protein